MAEGGTIASRVLDSSNISIFIAIVPQYSRNYMLKHRGTIGY